MNLSQFSKWMLVSALCFGGEVAAEGELSLAYVGDVFANVDGGIKTGEALLQNIDITYETSFANRFGSDDATFFGYVLYNDDTTFSDRYSGDAQVVSNIDTDEALRLYELWLNVPVGANTEILFGLFDLNSEFDAIDTAGLFLNSSHGIGPDYSQTGENGPSIFPSTSLALRVAWQINDQSSLRYAILDGVPGDPDESDKTAIDLGGSDGWLHALEYNHVFENGFRLGLGAWLYSADFETFDGIVDDDNTGLYSFIDGPLSEQLTAFVRIGMAEDSINAVDSYFGAGLGWTGPLASRADDVFGVAIAHINTGSPFKNVAGSGVESSETIIDLTYATQINDWLSLQPNLQYIINPGLDSSLDDALVVGVRFELSWTAGQ